MFSDAYYNLGVAYCENGSIDKAIVCYELAINFNPKCCEAYNNLGVIYKDQNNLERAIECYSSSLEIDSSFYQTLNNLSVVFTLKGEIDKARELIHAALVSNSAYAEAYNNLGVLYREEGRTEEAIQCYESCLKHAPNNINASQNHLLALNYRIQPLQLIFDSHKKWGLDFHQRLQLNGEIQSSIQNHLERSLLGINKIRIGYFCPNFFFPYMECFMEGILQNHDPDTFEIYWWVIFVSLSK